MKFVNLVIQQSTVGIDEDPIVLNFETDMDSKNEITSAMRSAIKSYLSSEEGREDIENNNGVFNWGDAAVSMPANAWKKYGLTPYPQSIVTLDIGVDHDENLAG